MEISIVDLQRVISTGSVVSATFTFHKTLGSHTAEHKELIVLFCGDENSDEYIAYNDLTEDVVKNWVLEKYTSQELAEFEDVLDEILARKQNPDAYAVGMPWAE